MERNAIVAAQTSCVYLQLWILSRDPQPLYPADIAQIALCPKNLSLRQQCVDIAIRPNQHRLRGGLCGTGGVKEEAVHPSC